MHLTPSSRMRLVAPLTAAAAVCLALTSALPAAAAPGGSGQGAFHDHIDVTGPDVVCGIDVTAQGGVDIVFAPDHGKVGISVYRQRITFTAANGNAVTAAGTEVDRYSEVVNADGTITVTFDILGSPERLSVSGHGVATIDAGRIHIVDVLDFSLDDPLVSETVTINGPHPEWDSQFELGCRLITAALS